jgi:hypothetical protein
MFYFYFVIPLETSIILCIVLYQPIFSLTGHMSSLFAKPSPVTIWFFSTRHLNECQVVSYSGLMFHFMVTNDGEYHYIY